ncbi:hypothetical protein B4113_1820 [Geobacillus sp. B4113_201601]|nr:hypothetical protein B4113_1820 [Geobacillus sp. B4113_201601]
MEKDPALKQLFSHIGMVAELRLFSYHYLKYKCKIRQKKIVL